MMLRIAMVLLAAIGASSSARAEVAAATTTTVLVTDLWVDPQLSANAEALTQSFVARLNKARPHVEVRSLAEAKTTLERAALAQMIGAEGDAGLSQLPQYLDVARVAFGRVLVVGDVIEVQVRLFNTAQGITEAAYARRLKRSADLSLLLVALDGLSDRLAAYLIDTYGEGGPSAAFTALSRHQLKPAPERLQSEATLSTLAVVGAGVGGAGVALAASSGVAFASTSEAQPLTPILMGTGAALAVLGAGLVVADVFLP